MKTINDLFKNIYGVEPANDEQIKVFIDCLKERLSYKEKEYISRTYQADLFSDEEHEKRIRVLMSHPVYKKEIFNQGDEITEIFEKCKGEDTISISYIQRKFSKGFPTARKIIDELVGRDLIVLLPNGKYKIKGE